VQTRPNSPSPTVFFRVLTLALLWLVSASPVQGARGEWYDHYEEALQAIENGRPRRAVDLLGAALARRSRSGYFRTYGNNYLRYVPQFWLGVAYHDLDDCERALASFDRSEAAAETADEPVLAARLRALRTACEFRLAPPPPSRIVAQRDGSPSSSPPAAEAPPEIASTAESTDLAGPEEAGPTPDPATLERGLRAFLAGDLPSAVRAFDELVHDAPESATSHLLLGTALHAQWSAEGQGEPELLERSRRELSLAARLDPRVAPDPALCSPRVVALYRSVR
jgi:tetratricopeptide (TPR) repeat protein